MNKVASFFLRLKIEWTRVFDHTWRRFLGLPLLANSQITPQFFVGGQYTHRGFRTLQKMGVTAIVSMRSRLPIDPSKHGMKSLHLPTGDQHAPTLEQLRTGAQFIQQEIAAGGKVYVHCQFGEGRGPTMAIAYLISTGLTLQDALAEVRRARSFVQPTSAQMQQLKEFADQLF